MTEQPSGNVRDRQDVAVVFGREFSAAVVLFNDAVGRQLGLSATERKILDVLDRRAGRAPSGPLPRHRPAQQRTSDLPGPGQPIRAVS
jgi:hypothetical protein